VLCAGKVDAPLNAVRQVLGRLDLTLNETKTRIVDARQESFNFLGFAIRVSKGWKSAKLSACLPGSEISCENQTAYNAIDRTRAHTDTAGRYCLEHERHPAWVGELLPLSQFSVILGKVKRTQKSACAYT